RLLLFIEWCSYQAAHIVITVNGSVQQFAITRGHCPREKVFIVRNGPDLARLKPAVPECALKRGRRYLLAYVGVMDVQDGVEFALRALHDLVHKRGRHDVSMVLIGTGDHVPILHQLAHDLQLDEYAHFTGWLTRDEMMRYLATADVGIGPD